MADFQWRTIGAEEGCAINDFALRKNPLAHGCSIERQSMALQWRKARPAPDFPT
jgi:hypothetical protein